MRCRSLIAFSLLVIIGLTQPLEAKSFPQDIKNPTHQNTDPVYRELRNLDVTEGYIVEDLMIKRDVGTFTFKTGTISFAPPVNGKVVLGVFIGEGEFSLTPIIDLEKKSLWNYTSKETLIEPFNKMVMIFSDNTYEEIKGRNKPGSVDPQSREHLKDIHNKLKNKLKTTLAAEILGYVYNPKRPSTFQAFISGRKYNDLAFAISPYGAYPGISRGEEVALVNYNWGAMDSGFWYLTHTESEWKQGTASSSIFKSLIDVEHYKIDTAIKGEKFDAFTELTFKAENDGERALNFEILPTLRVHKVSLNNAETGFIQEKKDDDSNFIVIFPEPLVKGQKYTVRIEYSGNKVIEDAGGGNFGVGARTSWYPNVNSFSDYATFDMTFTYPNKYILVGVGKKVKEEKEGDYLKAQWVSDIPLAVAGFNYGRFKKKEIVDTEAKYTIEGYATSDLPDYMKGTEDVGGMSPVRMLEGAMIEAQNSLRIFNHWFGQAPYGRIAITQQPQFNFGQSWPTLVYLPFVAFLDSTQRWSILGMQQGLTNFVQEVTSHEVAHQWWGHMVCWSSYHDQWLSEGFSNFSASLYLQYTQGGKLDKYLKYWENEKKAILEKNSFGLRPNDIGPIWMGQRLSTPKAPRAYQNTVYPKGGYVLHMLRWMMYDRTTGDTRFQDMMKDFVKTNLYKNASTENFQLIVEKHMTPNMDLDGNKRMDWFFRQWVYGTEIPSYKFDYTLTSTADGKALLKGTVTQSGVSPNFKMIVPIYLDFDGKITKLGSIGVVGNSTTKEIEVILPQKPKRAMINYHYDILSIETINNGK